MDAEREREIYPIQEAKESLHIMQFSTQYHIGDMTTGFGQASQK